MRSKDNETFVIVETLICPLKISHFQCYFDTNGGKKFFSTLNLIPCRIHQRPGDAVRTSILNKFVVIQLTAKFGASPFT